MTSALPRDPVIFIRSAILAVLMAAVAYTWADPDLWGHVLFGRDIVTNGLIPQHDPYSFTSDQPWVNHEWLSEVFMFVAYGALDTAGLVVLKLVVVGSLLTVVYLSLRRHALPAMAQDFLLFVAVIGAIERLTPIRPQLFSLLLFVVLLALLVKIEQGHRRLLLALPVVMMLWANFHGGWLVGMGTLGVWTLATLLASGTGKSDRLPLVAAAVISVVATLATPYGLGMWHFLGSTVGLERADITEWQPIYVFPYLLIRWVISAAIVIAVLLRARATVLASHLGVVVMLGLASFRVSRLDAFFALSVVLLLAPAVGELWRRGANPTKKPSVAPSRPAVVVVTVAASLVILAAGTITVRNGTCIQMNLDGLPDAEAADFVGRNDLRGRMLTWFDWGQYAIWHFSPAIQVSMDGRRETVYSDELVWKHLRFYFDAAGSQDLVSELNPDYIWLPRHLEAVAALGETGWRPVFEGPRSVILTDRPQGELQPVSAGSDLRCFPGP